MSARILLCTDLDRTLIPNGPQSESATARRLFHQVVDRNEITLTYVTGRHLQLVKQAIRLYQLPEPDYIIGDVGSTIYQKQSDRWIHWQEWEDEISPLWAGKTHLQLKELLDDISILRMQEMQKQNTHKLSYYVPLHTDHDSLIEQINSRLKNENINAGIIWSIDEPAAIGLLDIVPANASKHHAIEFLIEKQNYDYQHTVFAGDSGNDLPVIVSRIQSVLVANASEEVKQQALTQTANTEFSQALYIAHGDFYGMNGNYSAGILEGLVHFLPETEQWLTDLL